MKSSLLIAASIPVLAWTVPVGAQTTDPAQSYTATNTGNAAGNDVASSAYKYDKHQQFDQQQQQHLFELAGMDGQYEPFDHRQFELHAHERVDQRQRQYGDHDLDRLVGSLMDRQCEPLDDGQLEQFAHQQFDERQQQHGQHAWTDSSNRSMTDNSNNSRTNNSTNDSNNTASST